MAVIERGPDPNEGRNDPMVAEHWQLGEDVQDKIRSAGYESETVEGIAVDLHDLLQSADRIRDDLAPAILNASGSELVGLLHQMAFEFEHIRWHCDSATEYLTAAQAQLGQPT
jgi:hypothetical protein